MSYDRNKVLNIARAELGYHEKASNAYLDDKTANSGSGNFTKYARDLDALGFFYNGPKQGFAYCDVGVDWCFVKAYGVEAALELLCQPRYSAGAGCYYSAMYFKQCGRFHGPGSIPQPGDQVFFEYKAGDVSHTGLVESVSGNSFTAIEFNTSDMVARRSYSFFDSAIHGYGRPNYGTVAEDINVPSSGETVYDGKTVTELAQEVIAGKWGIGAERVAALTAAGYDYTVVQDKVNELLSAPSDTPAAGSVAEESGYTSGATIEETVFNFCLNVLGLCVAAACGVLANVGEESGFSLGAIGDGGTSFGLCQWHASRNTALREWCGSNGMDYRTADGQLWYMKHELETSHKATLNALRGVPNTADGAYEAGRQWCVLFEVPSDMEAKSKQRGGLARAMYWPKYSSSQPAQTPAEDSAPTPAATPTAAKGTYTITLAELTEGDRGSAVERVQALLIAQGYTCGGKTRDGREIPDGVFGPTTKKAVEKFQTASGLSADGVVGSATMTALLK